MTKSLQQWTVNISGWLNANKPERSSLKSALLRPFADLINSLYFGRLQTITKGCLLNLKKKTSGLSWTGFTKQVILAAGNYLRGRWWSCHFSLKKKRNAGPLKWYSSLICDGKNFWASTAILLGYCWGFSGFLLGVYWRSTVGLLGVYWDYAVCLPGV